MKQMRNVATFPTNWKLEDKMTDDYIQGSNFL